MEQLYRQVLRLVASPRSFKVGIGGMKIAIAIVFLWIGALKFISYEADSITPLWPTVR